ncbi:hypothetical protein KUTeg_014039 [Tegillarca granosa]|uniref:Uncharacterized protein n=1 Tax=Tegillarca granosa TaxID=220873 RepID=A0ABQ9F0M0_TEGGR|nr:hypothetical protein KUTeg_014039 [Tegillarca granosa]
MKRILIYTYIIFLCVKHINPEKNRSKKASAADSCFCKFLLDSRQKQYCIPENNFSPQYYLQLSSRLKEDVDLFLQEHFLVFMELQRETNDKLKRNFLLYSSSRLHGEVDDCSCKVESLDSLNNQKVYPRLQSILSKDYFKYFKYSKDAQQEHSCDQERELSALDTTISEESKKAFKDGTKYDDAQETFCELDDENAGCEYVNLLLNPERYTGYAGASPNRIWNRMCLEKRAFYRLISGLHTSINIHLSAKYLLPAKNGYGTGKWGHNVQEFLKRFSREQTNGEGPQRLKNLYFTYLVVLRAVAKAAPYLEEENFYTGNPGEDLDVKNGVLDLLSVVKSFPDHFDESKLFQGNQKEAKILKEEFRNHFRNVSRIMDCVGCDKCRLWGKLQVQGLGTALKILFSGDGIGLGSTVNANEKKKFQLRRTEIVSLINGFGRIHIFSNADLFYYYIIKQYS